MNDGLHSETNRQLMLKLTVGLYGIMGATSLAWGFFRDRPNIWFHPEPLFDLPWFVTVPVGGLVGAGVGIGVSVLSIWMSRNIRWAHQLMIEFMNLLGGLGVREILIIATLSSVGEELFFRGILLPGTTGIFPGSGLVISSLAFGLLHVPTSAKMIPWTLQALLLGFLIGLLFMVTGDLTVCVVLHFTVNFRNLRYIQGVTIPPENRNDSMTF
jgi:hypothetical protein